MVGMSVPGVPFSLRGNCRLPGMKGMKISYNNSRYQSGGNHFLLAERVGFEPTKPGKAADFKSAPLDHSGTSPPSSFFSWEEFRGSFRDKGFSKQQKGQIAQITGNRIN